MFFTKYSFIIRNFKFFCLFVWILFGWFWVFVHKGNWSPSVATGLLLL